MIQMDGGQRYKPEIDGLRAIAVIAVLVYHLELIIGETRIGAGGFIGVDVFFVISGYLITSQIRQQQSLGQFKLREFYARRIIRLLPALLVVLVVVTGAGWFFMLPKAYDELSRSALASVFFSSNILFFLQDGYNAEPSQIKPLLHTWSLGVEEQFYLLFPLLLIAIKRLFNPCGGWLLLFIGLGSFGVAHFSWPDHSESAFFLPIARIWEFVAGGLLTYLAIDRLNFPKTIRLVFALAGFALILIPVSFFTSDTPHPSHLTFAPVLGSCLLICFGNNTGLARFLLQNSAMGFIGRISYALYLWHWPIIVFDRGFELETNKFLISAVSIALATATWYFVETPTRNAKNTRGVFVIIGGCFAALSLFAAAVIWSKGAPGRLAFNTEQSHRDGFEHKGRKCHHFETCHVNWETGENRIILAGDSHAGAISGAVAENFLKDGHAYAQYTSSACMHVMGLNVLINPERFNVDCNERAATFDKFLQSSKPSIIVHFNYFNWWLGGVTARNYDGIPRSPAIGGRGDLENKEVSQIIAEAYKKWTEYGHKIVVIGPVPELLFNPFNSFKKGTFFKSGETPLSTIERHNGHSSPFNALIVKARGLGANLEVFDPTPLFCEQTSCRFQLNGRILYTDYDHLSRAGAELFAPRFHTWFEEQGIIK